MFHGDHGGALKYDPAAVGRAVVLAIFRYSFNWILVLISVRYTRIYLGIPEVYPGIPQVYPGISEYI